MDIYRQFYPQHWMPDNLELEILERDLLERHPGAQASMARLAQTRFTLGELFAAVHSEISHRRPDAPASVA